MRVLWNCDSCSEPLYAMSDYVVVLESNNRRSNRHLCRECYDEIMQHAYIALSLRAAGLLQEA